MKKSNLFTPPTSAIPNRYRWFVALSLVTIVSINPAFAVQLKTLTTFNTNGTTGYQPMGTLALDAAGNLYGTTANGGKLGGGVVFKLTPPPAGSTQWTRTTLTNFTYNACSFSGLIFDAIGNLYGTTAYGGKYGEGAVFRLSPPKPGSTQWTQTTLYSLFSYDINTGVNPYANPIIDSAGNLYGITHTSGINGERGGIVFKLTPPTAGSTQWTRTTLTSFYNPDNISDLMGSLVFDTSGNLYGTTQGTGDSVSGGGGGTVFKLTPPASGSTEWTRTRLFEFNNFNGLNPWANLIIDTAGNLYGTTSEGGLYGQGTVFKLSPPNAGSTQWNLTTLVSFNDKNGRLPYGGLIFDNKGNLYGTTWGGGRYDAGTVFKLTPPPAGFTEWTHKILVLFNNTNGAHPYASLVRDSSGNLYGTTSSGGAGGVGTVFKLTP